MTRLDSADSIDLVTRFGDGNSEAAAELDRRFTGRLTTMVGRRLSPKLRRRIDPVDVVQTAWCMLFRGLRERKFHVVGRGKLSALLHNITDKTLRKMIEVETAQKRDFRAEESVTDPLVAGRAGEWAVAPIPTPEQLVRDAELAQRIRQQLTDRQRRMLDLWEQNYSQAEIHEQVGVSYRTVRRFFGERLPEVVQRVSDCGSVC